MKKLISGFGLLFFFLSSHAQTEPDASQYLYYERFQSAEKSFHSSLQKQPDNAEAWYGLTRAYLYQNKKADTLRFAPVAIQNEPYFQTAMGYLYLNQDKKDSAEMFFNKALDRTRYKNASILAAVARAHIETGAGNANYAIELLNKAIKRDKRDASLHVLLGDAYSKLNNGTQAYMAYKDAIDKNSNLAAAYFKVAEIFKTQKNQEMYLEYYNRAIETDNNYAPALYRLYAHYFYYDPAMSLDYYNRFMTKSDASIDNAYDLADLYFVNKQFDKAIEKTNEIFTAKSQDTEPRLYKLLAYSHAGLKDSLKAIGFMNQYFEKEADSNYMAKDFVLMASLFTSAAQPDSAISYLTRATKLETDSTLLRDHYKSLAELAGDQKDYAGQAMWLGRYYTGNDKANNLDLFNWALAWFRAEDYMKADSVFGMYVAKYPEQSFGYYWQARANAALDKEMKEGLAIPHYQKLIEVLQKDTNNANYRSWMIQAYGYLASYEANTEKDYDEAVNYFEKVLEVDPQNEEAKKYISVLEERISAEETSDTK